MRLKQKGKWGLTFRDDIFHNNIGSPNGERFPDIVIRLLRGAVYPRIYFGE